MRRTFIILLLGSFCQSRILLQEEDECSFANEDWCNFWPLEGDDLPWEIKSASAFPQQEGLPPTGFDGDKKSMWS